MLQVAATLNLQYSYKSYLASVYNYFYANQLTLQDFEQLFYSNCIITDRGWEGGRGMGWVVKAGKWIAGGGLYLSLGRRQQCCTFSK